MEFNLISIYCHRTFQIPWLTNPIKSLVIVEVPQNKKQNRERTKKTFTSHTFHTFIDRYFLYFIAIFSSVHSIDKLGKYVLVYQTFLKQYEEGERVKELESWKKEIHNHNLSLVNYKSEITRWWMHVKFKLINFVDIFCETLFVVYEPTTNRIER